MNKSLMQKKFRFVMVIAAIALFVTIFTPTYINAKGNGGFPKVIWMWTVLFGAGGGNKLSPLFNFNWFAFIGYAMAIIVLIISLARKFIALDADDKKGKGAYAVDAICMICCLISLIMFVIVPFSVSEGMSVEAAGAVAVKTYYGWCVSYILAFIILVVMFGSSVTVLLAETIIKIKKIRAKKNAKETKAVKENKETKVEKEETKEVIEDNKE